MVIHGVYHFAPRSVAYRNDYCLSCDAVQVAERVRTLDVLHIYFVPLLPLGFWSRWRCAVCRRDPHARTRSSQGFKIFTVVMFGLFSLFGFAMAIGVGLFGGERPSDPSLLPVAAVFCIAMPLCTVAAILWCRIKPPTDLKQQLPHVPPVSRDTCLYCKGGLDVMGFCSRCRVRRMELAQTAQPRIVR